MTVGIKILHLAVISPFVGNIKRRGNGAAVWINASLLEEISVQLLVEVVDRIVEGQQNNLRHLFDGHIDFIFGRVAIIMDELMRSDKMGWK